jgi:cyanophycinase
MGPIALHGGGEFLPGDERFVDELLAVAARAADERAKADIWPSHDVAGHLLERPRVRIAVIPAAAGRGQPDRAAALASEAFHARARAAGLPVQVDVARVVDAAPARHRPNAEAIAAADLAYLPGGDPDLIPGLLGPTTAGRALAAAWRRGAIVAGASAGAMALADWSWTSNGGIRGLGFVHGLVVVPHYDDVRRMAWQSSLEKVAPPGLGYLGLDERTGVISVGETWRVAGEGAAYWFRPGASTPVIARHEEVLDLPAAA